MIRTLARGDADVIAPLARQARVDAIPGFPDLHSPEEDVTFYRGVIEESEGLGFVDVVTGRLVGFIVWRDDLIEHLYVDVAHQRQGIGASLLAEALSRMSVRPVRLWTFEANERAVAFYAAHGFTIVDRTDGAGNEEHLPDLLLELD